MRQETKDEFTVGGGEGERGKERKWDKGFGRKNRKVGGSAVEEARDLEARDGVLLRADERKGGDGGTGTLGKAKHTAVAGIVGLFFEQETEFGQEPDVPMTKVSGFHFVLSNRERTRRGCITESSNRTGGAQRVRRGADGLS